MERVTTKTRPAQAETLSPFAAALAAFKAADREANRLSVAHTAATEAAEAVQRTDVALPPILTRCGNPITLIIDGRSVDTEPTAYTYRSRDGIETSDMIPAADKPAMVAALVAWEREQEAADVESGYASAASAVARAESMWHAAYSRAQDAGLAVLRTPASAKAEVAAKRKIIRQYFDDFEGDSDKVIEALLHAASAPTSPAPAAPPSQQGGDDAELVALDGELSALIEEDARRTAVHTERMERLHVAVDATVAAEGGKVTSDRLAEIWTAAQDEFGTHSGAADCEALHVDFERIRRRACGLRAATTAGLRVKIRLAAWYFGGFDADAPEISSLLRDAATILDVPAPDLTSEDLLAEYQALGGQLLLGVGERGLHIIFPPEPSTRATEIEVALADPAIAEDLKADLRIRGLVLTAPAADEDALAASRPEDREAGADVQGWIAPPTGLGIAIRAHFAGSGQ